MRPLLLVLVVLIGACSGNSGSVTTIPTQVTTSTTTTTTTVPTTTTTEPPPTLPEIARALVTPTGVVVSVLEETATGFRVTTPCGNEATVREGTTLGTTQVVIDPGHGGQVDTGAVGANGLMEKHLNLEVSQALEADLIVRGIDVVLTRTADYASRLGVRAGLADRVNADLLISIHH
ncbi:MAG: N-acetylmuramoyl-L-alanine amidase family protein, partial [Acidimicrobiia bacterium]